MDRGHSPDEIDQMRWSDVQDWLAIHDVLDARSSLGGIPEE